jgi:predicted alpha/beta-fold hydrolase
MREWAQFEGDIFRNQFRNGVSETEKKSQVVSFAEMKISNGTKHRAGISLDKFRQVVSSHKTSRHSKPRKYVVKFTGIPMAEFLRGTLMLLTLLFSRVIGVIGFIFLPLPWALVLMCFLASYEFFFRHPFPEGAGVIVARPVTRLQNAIETAISPFVAYEPPWWAMGPHSTTLLPVIPNKPPPKKVISQELDAPDGASLVLDWYIPDQAGDVRGVLLMTPGMNGSSNGGYIVDMMDRAGKLGFVTAVLAGRGTGLTTIDSVESAFHMGRSEDLFRALEAVEEFTIKRAPIYILGYSAGGVRAVNFASVYGDALIGRVAAVISFSGVVRNELTFKTLRVSKIVYQPIMVHAYACTLYSKMMPLLEGPRGDEVRRFFTQKSFSSFSEYDKAVTTKLHDFTYEEYQSLSMPVPSGLWTKISVPTLIVNACDDPVLHVHDSIVPELATTNSFITMMATEKGGHIGWPTKDGGFKWIADVTFAYITQIENHS